MANCSWELGLIEDVRTLVIQRMDPFVRILFELTSKANQARSYALRRKTGPRFIYGIWRLAMEYSTPHVMQWTLEVWPRIDQDYCTLHIALEAHNFDVAAWLLQEKGYPLLGQWFEPFLKNRDYSCLDWLYEHGMPVYWADLLYTGLLVDIQLQQWTLGKTLSGVWRMWRDGNFGCNQVVLYAQLCEIMFYQNEHKGFFI